MTSRERVIAALSHREADRTPIFEYYFTGEAAAKFLLRPFAGDDDVFTGLARAQGFDRALSTRARDILDLALLLRHDMLYVVPNPCAPVAEPEEKHTVEAPSAESVMETDPVEEVRRRPPPSPPPLECFEIYRRLKVQMDERGVDLPILAPAYAHGVWTDTALMQTMLLEPALAHAYFEGRTEAASFMVKTYAQLGIDMAGVGGDFAGNRGPIISPESYEKFIVPEVRKVARLAHQLGMKTVDASDGNLWPVIDQFLTGCEVDGYIEIDAGAGMDLALLKARFGAKITFFGNLDCGRVLSFAKPDEIRRQVKTCLTDGLGSGGHILCASNAITASIPIDNYLAITEEYRHFFGLEPLRLA